MSTKRSSWSQTEGIDRGPDDAPAAGPHAPSEPSVSPTPDRGVHQCSARSASSRSSRKHGCVFVFCLFFLGPSPSTQPCCRTSSERTRRRERASAASLESETRVDRRLRDRTGTKEDGASTTGECDERSFERFADLSGEAAGPSPSVLLGPLQVLFSETICRLSSSSLELCRQRCIVVVVVHGLSLFKSKKESGGGVIFL